MIKFIKNLKSLRTNKLNKGMTYVELIVVLSIFAVMTSVVMFNYSTFQAKVDIKNLVSDIALKVVEAQKSSLSGKLPPLLKQPLMVDPWKPSYGVYFDIDTGGDNKSFLYFVDLDNDGLFDGDAGCTEECLEKVTITKNDDYISAIEMCGDIDCTSFTPFVDHPLVVTFRRPNSGVSFKDSVTGSSLPNFNYLRITVASLRSATNVAYIKIYPSGRIQIN